MADILIRGMAMPQEGNWSWKTIRIYPDGTCAVPDWQGDCRVLSCIAVPLPEGHGRLIDADALLNEGCDVVEDHSGLDYDDPCPVWGYSADMICRAPTIVPAEGGGEE